MITRLLVHVFVLTTSVTALCATPTQSPRWHWFADEAGLALGGYDPVAYHTVAEALVGTEALEQEHAGLRYRFSDEATLELFREEPERYLPAFGGWCALGLGLDPKAIGAPQSRTQPDPTSFKLVDGRLLLYARLPGWDARSVWDRSDETILLERAEAFWQEREALAARVGTCPKGFNPQAPLETTQFDFIIGAWDSTYVSRVDPASDQTVTIRGDWKAWYGWQGYAIYDDWVQLGAPPNTSGPAIRSFDLLNKEWVMHYIPIGAPRTGVWSMTGRFDEAGELHGECTLIDGRGRTFLQRIHFVEITKESFAWRSDRSYDSGDNWIEGWGVGKNTRKTKAG